MTNPSSAPDSLDGQALLRHQLAGLAFRFTHAIGDAPAHFAAFEAGHGVRPPLSIVGHVVDVLEHGHRFLLGQGWTRERDQDRPGPAGDGSPSEDEPEGHAWARAIDDVYAALERLDALFVDTNATLDDDRIRAFVHGPLSDALTHVGQLALLRRLSGSPVAPVSYFRADVQAGRIRSDA